MSKHWKKFLKNRKENMKKSITNTKKSANTKKPVKATAKTRKVINKPLQRTKKSVPQSSQKPKKLPIKSRQSLANNAPLNELILTVNEMLKDGHVYFKKFFGQKV